MFNASAVELPKQRNYKELPTYRTRKLSNGNEHIGFDYDNVAWRIEFGLVGNPKHIEIIKLYRKGDGYME